MISSRLRVIFTRNAALAQVLPVWGMPCSAFLPVLRVVPQSSWLRGANLHRKKTQNLEKVQGEEEDEEREREDGEHAFVELLGSTGHSTSLVSIGTRGRNHTKLRILTLVSLPTSQHRFVREHLMRQTAGS